MPKIVDKDEKKRNIAIASIDLFAEHGLKTSMESIAKAANVGKGTVYLYFKTKEEIIIEIWNFVDELLDNSRQEKLNEAKSNAEKLLILFDFSELEKNGLAEKLLKIYAINMSLILTLSDEGLHENYNEHSCVELNEIKKYLQAGVDCGEFIELDVDMVGKLFQKMHIGILFDSMCKHITIEELKQEFYTQLDFLIKMIKKENR